MADIFLSYAREDETRARMAEKLAMLRALGDDSLLVPEARELGGFGFELDGGLYNVDTLKFFEVMIALERGAVLPRLLEPGGRRLVWEIGAGWGGFARVFKTVVPNTTYLIVDLPELFLFSGTYLQRLFPDAVIRYWSGEDGDTLFLDIGSTTAFIAVALQKHQNLFVVTNSVAVAHALATRNNNRVFFSGGELRSHDGGAFGIDSIAFVRRFNVRHAILSVTAINAPLIFPRSRVLRRTPAD